MYLQSFKKFRISKLFLKKYISTVSSLVKNKTKYNTQKRNFSSNTNDPDSGPHVFLNVFLFLLCGYFYSKNEDWDDWNDREFDVRLNDLIETNLRNRNTKS
jgi:hypothetical protein